MQSSGLRVLVVDDSESVRRSICQVLRTEADIEVVCEAVDGVDAVNKVKEHQPDVVLLDITMPAMNGLEAAEILKKEFPSVQVLIISQHDSRGFQWAALAAGVSGYVIKTKVGTDLIPALRKIQDQFLGVLPPATWFVLPNCGGWATRPQPVAQVHHLACRRIWHIRPAQLIWAENSQ